MFEASRCARQLNQRIFSGTSTATLGDAGRASWHVCAVAREQHVDGTVAQRSRGVHVYRGRCLPRAARQALHDDNRANHRGAAGLEQARRGEGHLENHGETVAPQERRVVSARRHHTGGTCRIGFARANLVCVVNLLSRRPLDFQEAIEMIDKDMNPPEAPRQPWLLFPEVASSHVDGSFRAAITTNFSWVAGVYVAVAQPLDRAV